MFMEVYDQKIVEEEVKVKEEEGVFDEEGWVKVICWGWWFVFFWIEVVSLWVLERERWKCS